MLDFWKRMDVAKLFFLERVERICVGGFEVLGCHAFRTIMNVANLLFWHV